jgi:hypothetical protein
MPFLKNIVRQRTLGTGENELDAAPGRRRFRFYNPGDGETLLAIMAHGIVLGLWLVESILWLGSNTRKARPGKHHAQPAFDLEKITNAGP